MKVVSFNINSLRARLHQLEAVVKSHAPDVIGLQETKVADESFPVSDVEALGYHVAYHGQKGHYGVAIMTKLEPLAIIKGFPNDPDTAQKRCIGAQLTQDNGRLLTVFNGYFPQGEARDHPVKFPYKAKFYADLAEFLPNFLTPEQDTVVMGDFNIGPEDKDIGIGEENAKRWLRTGKCCFLPEERAWFAQIRDLGLVDSFRHFFPESTQCSWFDYRSRGFEREPKRGLRIDLVMTNPQLIAQAERLAATDAVGIDHQIRGMEKPSDHCPVWFAW